MKSTTEDGDQGAPRVVTRDELAKAIAETVRHLLQVEYPAVTNSVLLALGAPAGATEVKLWPGPVVLPEDLEERAEALWRIAWPDTGVLSSFNRDGYLRLAAALPPVEEGHCVEVEAKDGFGGHRVGYSGGAVRLHHSHVRGLLGTDAPGTYTVRVTPKSEPEPKRVRPWRARGSLICPRCKSSWSDKVFLCDSCDAKFAEPIDLPDPVEADTQGK